MSDASERVREARGAVEEVVWNGGFLTDKECHHRFDAYAAAVRAAVLQEVAHWMDELSNEARQDKAHFEAVEAYATARNVILFRATLPTTGGTDAE